MKTETPKPSVQTENPYLRDASPYLNVRLGDPKIWLDDPEGMFYRMMDAQSARDDLVHRYAWAIPNEEALNTVAEFSPIVEIGAGTGYWAALLQAKGVDVKPYDISPPETGKNAYHSNSWTKVLRGGPEKAASHSERTLLLCWPPYGSTMAQESLSHYSGEHVIYVGEWCGCTADSAFHADLASRFNQVRFVEIPTWNGIHDRLSVWKRKTRRRKLSQ